MVDGGMALAQVVAAEEIDRLRICAAPTCHAVLLDLSRNSSKRYCDASTCGNRLHVAAYRERKRSEQLARQTLSGRLRRRSSNATQRSGCLAAGHRLGTSRRLRPADAHHGRPRPGDRPGDVCRAHGARAARIRRRDGGDLQPAPLRDRAGRRTIVKRGRSCWGGRCSPSRPLGSGQRGPLARGGTAARNCRPCRRRGRPGRWPSGSGGCFAACFPADRGATAPAKGRRPAPRADSTPRATALVTGCFFPRDVPFRRLTAWTSRVVEVRKTSSAWPAPSSGCPARVRRTTR